MRSGQLAVVRVAAISMGLVVLSGLAASQSPARVNRPVI
jgi:hypothetical protein